MEKYTFTYNDLTSDNTKFMRNVGIIGALLSFDNDTEIFTVWNTNLTEWEPYSETITTPSQQYGDVIGVCVGKGLWVYTAGNIGWGNHKWANSTSDTLYAMVHTQTILSRSGYENTQHIYNVHSNDNVFTGTVWEQIHNSSVIPHTKLHDIMFIPSYIELSEVQQNISKRYTEDIQQAFWPYNYSLMNLGYLVFNGVNVDPANKAALLISSSDYCVSTGKYICHDFRTTEPGIKEKNTGDTYLIVMMHF